MKARTLVVFPVAVAMLGGCRVRGPVGDQPGAMVTSPEAALVAATTREVLAKRSPDTLIARDGSSCRVSSSVYANTAVGSQLRCPWVPSTDAPGA